VRNGLSSHVFLSQLRIGVFISVHWVSEVQ